MVNFRLSAFSDEAGMELARQVAALKRNGIGLMEIRGVNGKNVSKLSDEEAREVVRVLDGEGIGFSAMGSPFGKYPIDQPFGPHLDEFRRGLELCNILGIARMRMFSFYPPKGQRPEACREEVLSRLNVMLDLAEAAGVQLAHENEKGIYGDTDVRCRDLKDALGGRLGVIFDPANFVQCGVEILPALRLLAKDVVYAHIKDADMADGCVVPSGCGDGHVCDVLRAFEHRDGEFILTLEPHLKVFDGLAALQSEGLKHRYSYHTADAAFDAAAKGMKDCLNQIGYAEKEMGVWRR